MDVWIDMMICHGCKHVRTRRNNSKLKWLRCFLWIFYNKIFTFCSVVINVFQKALDVFQQNLRCFSKKIPRYVIQKNLNVFQRRIAGLFLPLSLVSFLLKSLGFILVELGSEKSFRQCRWQVARNRRRAPKKRIHRKGIESSNQPLIFRIMSLL